MEPRVQLEERLRRFILWLQENGVQLRVSTIKSSEGKSKGLGVFSVCDNNEGVLMVTPLYLAITPMNVLQDPEFGKVYAKLFEDGDVDDRLLMFVFLMVERIRESSSFWAPYLDVLPTSFGTPLWFTEKELQELKGTALYNATKIQLKNLKALFANKVKPFAQQFLSSIGVFKREIDFQDFLWANCIFWTRALNIPCPHSFVFPKKVSKFVSGGSGNTGLPASKHSNLNVSDLVCDTFPKGDAEDHSDYLDGSISVEKQSTTSNEAEPETVWVEGLVPGIDFCNHAPKGVAHWEVDGVEGSTTGVPNSMYLITDRDLSADNEILISYGNKGNEELLYLYGFVVENNPDDYFMIHFPKEALDLDPCGELKIQLLQEQTLILRWLLPGALLQKGFYNEERINPPESIKLGDQACCSYSWSGNRKPPSFLNRFVFPEETIAALRVVAMKEDEMQTVLSMLDELSQSGLQKVPSGEDVQAAVWEVCGNAGALQLLTDLIAARLLDLEEGTGSEVSDKELLDRDSQEQDPNCTLSENVRSCVIYRKGQKYLAKHFLKESEHLLELCILEEHLGREKSDQHDIVPENC